VSGAVRAERRGAVLEITLDRPKANAIDAATSRALAAAFAAFRDDPALRVAIVTAAGERFFSAGWDLKAAAAGPEDTRWTRLGTAHAYVGLLAYAKGDVKDARRYFSTAPYLDRSWLEYSVIDTWRRAAEG